VPARVAGGWDWELNVDGRRVRYATFLEQRFQTVEGVARAGDRREVIDGVTLRGADFAFSLNITVDPLGLTRHDFSGKVNGDEIVGTVTLTPSNKPAMTLPWRARRATRSAYFGPTGTAMFQPPNQPK
jgi:hypothetical protein